MERPNWRRGRNRAFRRVMHETEVPERRAEVAFQVVLGYPDKDVATILGISVHGVKKHKRALYATFHVHERGDFVKVLRVRMGDGPEGV